MVGMGLNDAKVMRAIATELFDQAELPV